MIKFLQKRHFVNLHSCLGEQNQWYPRAGNRALDHSKFSAYSGYYLPSDCKCPRHWSSDSYRACNYYSLSRPRPTLLLARHFQSSDLSTWYSSRDWAWKILFLADANAPGLLPSQTHFSFQWSPITPHNDSTFLLWYLLHTESIKKRRVVIRLNALNLVWIGLNVTYFKNF